MRNSGEDRSRAAETVHDRAIVVDGCFPIHTGPMGYSERMMDRAREMVGAGMRFAEIRPEMAALYDQEWRRGSTDFLDWCSASGATAFHTTIGRVAGGTGPEAFDSAVREIAIWQRRFDAPNGPIKVVRASDFERAKREERIAVILGFQNTTHLVGDLANVDFFRSLGVRIIQLTYNLQNRAGSGCTERGDGGLSHYGVRLVRKLNEAAVLIDLSHCGEATSRDAIEQSDSPVAFTHTTCKAVFDHVRGKSDDLLRRLASRDGYAGILLIPSFIAPERPSVEHFVDHLVHAASILGIENVGIGTDRGTYPPLIREVIEREKSATLQEKGVTEVGWRLGDFLIPEPSVEGYRDWRDLPRLTEAMLRRGLTEREVAGVLGLNFVRIFRDAVG